MDILDRLLTRIEKALGPEVFTEELAEAIERQFRHDFGAEAHYIASLRAYEMDCMHREVLRLINSGLQDSDIAERIGITRQHAWRLRRRLLGDSSPPSPV